MQNKSEKFAAEPGVRFRSDAVEGHLKSRMHEAAHQSELLQRVLVFQHEVEKKKSVNTDVLHTVFKAAYYLVKEHIPNSKLPSLVKLMEDSGLHDLKYFAYTAQGTLRDIFILLGETVKSLVLEQVRRRPCFGLTANEVADIAAKENLVTFIR